MIPFWLQEIKHPEWNNFRVRVKRLSSEYTPRTVLDKIIILLLLDLNTKPMKHTKGFPFHGVTLTYADSAHF